MNYTVNTSPSAEAELTEIYVNASNKKAVTEASNALDKELEVDAHVKGRDCDGDRIIRIGPLLAFFAVYPDEQRVEILQLAYVEPA